MKTIFFAIMLISGMAIAQSKPVATPPVVDAGHIEMHEKMAKAHQQAADCLKSGKTFDECRAAFQMMCKESGEPGNCGMKGSMKDRKGRKGTGK